MSWLSIPWRLWPHYTINVVNYKQEVCFLQWIICTYMRYSVSFFFPFTFNGVSFFPESFVISHFPYQMIPMSKVPPTKPNISSGQIKGSSCLEQDVHNQQGKRPAYLFPVGEDKDIKFSYIWLLISQYSLIFMTAENLLFFSGKSLYPVKMLFNKMGTRR